MADCWFSLKLWLVCFFSFPLLGVKSGASNFDCLPIGQMRKLQHCPPCPLSFLYDGMVECVSFASCHSFLSLNSSMKHTVFSICYSQGLVTSAFSCFLTCCHMVFIIITWYVMLYCFQFPPFVTLSILFLFYHLCFDEEIHVLMVPPSVYIVLQIPDESTKT